MYFKFLFSLSGSFYFQLVVSFLCIKRSSFEDTREYTTEAHEKKSVSNAKGMQLQLQFITILCEKWMH